MNNVIVKEEFDRLQDVCRFLDQRWDVLEPTMLNIIEYTRKESKGDDKIYDLMRDRIIHELRKIKPNRGLLKEYIKGALNSDKQDELPDKINAAIEKSCKAVGENCTEKIKQESGTHIRGTCPNCGYFTTIEEMRDVIGESCFVCQRCGETYTYDNKRTFDSGAVRDNADGKGRMDLLPWNAIRELSKHCERGANHYGENNARKGIPMSSLMDSAARRLAQYISGDKEEPYHLVAACWNVMFALEQQTTHPELNDLPWQRECEHE